MNHRYTAKVYLEDGEVLLNTGDDVEQLIVWMNEQAEASFDSVKCEVIDNITQKIVKNYQYSPPER